MELREQGLWVTDVVPFLRQGFDDSGTTSLGLEGRLIFMKKCGYESPVAFSIPAGPAKAGRTEPFFFMTFLPQVWI
jgi:hypothetical protein